MRVVRTSDFANAEVRGLVGETDHHLAWTPNLSNHIALTATSERSVAGITLHTAPLQQSTLAQLRDAVAPLLAADPALPDVASDGIEVLVSGMEASTILRDPGSSKEQRWFCTAKVIAQAEETLVDISKPYIPALKRIEPWNFCISVLIECGDAIFSADLADPSAATK